MLLSCDREETNGNRNAKKYQSNKGSKTTGKKKCGRPFLLKGKELSRNEGWLLLIACGFHNHFAAENLK